MEKSCQNDLCANDAVGQLPIIRTGPGQQKRVLCAVCRRAYDWGVEDGRRRWWPRRVWVLAVADRGIVAHTGAFRTKRRAIAALIEYLKANEGYDGPADMPSISNWLGEHDERLGADIFPAALEAD